MILYQGSQHQIQNPKFGEGFIKNDYGQGFYCTESENLAKEWAVLRGTDGFLNKYDLDVSKLSILDLSSSAYKPIHWIVILLKNRTFAIDSFTEKDLEYLIETFSISCQSDLISGYRADDAYFRFAQDFLNDTLSYEKLAKAMRLGNLGKQIVLKSEQSFQSLTYLGSERVEKAEWYDRQQERDKSARAEYFQLKRDKNRHRGLYLSQIIDERMTADDPRL